MAMAKAERGYTSWNNFHGCVVFRGWGAVRTIGVICFGAHRILPVPCLLQVFEQYLAWSKLVS